MEIENGAKRNEEIGPGTDRKTTSVPSRPNPSFEGGAIREQTFMIMRFEVRVRRCIYPVLSPTSSSGQANFLPSVSNIVPIPR